MTRAKSGAVSGSRSKRRRANEPRAPGSPKATQIVELVEALSGELGVRDGAYLGGNLARLLAELYEDRRRPAPRWVRELVTYYSDKSRTS